MTTSLTMARDRIVAIDGTLKALAEERESLVNYITSEGFALLADGETLNQDWRTWKLGDIVEVVRENDDNLPIGSKYKVREVEEPHYAGRYAVAVYTSSADISFCWPGTLGRNSEFQHPFKLVEKA